jgi:hypothetical protein
MNNTMYYIIVDENQQPVSGLYVDKKLADSRAKELTSFLHLFRRTFTVQPVQETLRQMLAAKSMQELDTLSIAVFDQLQAATNAQEIVELRRVQNAIDSALNQKVLDHYPA